MKCCSLCRFRATESDEEPCISCVGNILVDGDFFEAAFDCRSDATVDLEALPLGSAAEERQRAILWMRSAHTGHCNAEYWRGKYRRRCLDGAIASREDHSARYEYIQRGAYSQLRIHGEKDGLHFWYSDGDGTPATFVVSYANMAQVLSELWRDMSREG